MNRLEMFDPRSLLQQLETFARTAPSILRRSGLTAELADEVARVWAAMEPPFRLAVVGRMRTGKSTLINALLGEDLAITDVNETTATINWLKHGTPDQARKFHVVWKDRLSGDDEEYDFDKRDAWKGDSELAKRTRYLEFFSTAEFLKLVEIIDTPGAGSVLSHHEAPLHDFMTERREGDELASGGSADCIVYVLGNVIRENDSKLLGEFESHGRLPDTSPYNSVAVLHKWEALDHRSDEHPGIVARRLAGKMSQALRANVAEVIPVSGMLSQAVRRLSPDWWDRLARLAVETPPERLERLITKKPAKDGTSRPTDSTPEFIARRRLLDDSVLGPVAAHANGQAKPRLPWPCFTAVLKIAAHGRLGDGAVLRAEVEKLSGMDQLLEFLNRRFFDRSRMIRASNLLGKALRPCELAGHRLRLRLSELDSRAAQGRQSLEELNRLRANAARTREFVETGVAEIEREQRNLEGIQSDLEIELRGVRDRFNQFDRDLAVTRVMDDDHSLFDERESVEILAILGARGYSVAERLTACVDTGNLMEAAERRLSYWLARTEASAGKRRQVLKQVVARLEEAIEELTNVSERMT